MNFLVKLADFTWQKVIVIALLACGAYYWFMFDDGTALDQNLITIRNELDTAKEMLVKTEKAMKDLERFKEELNTQQAHVREVMSFLPSQMNVSDLVSTVQDRANGAGMKITKSEPKDDVAKIEFYEAMRLDIQLQGTYSQVATFLSNLSQLPRLVTIDKISLRLVPSADAENPKLDFSATLVAYRSVEEAKPEGDGADKAPTKAGASNGT